MIPLALSIACRNLPAPAYAVCVACPHRSCNGCGEQLSLAVSTAARKLTVKCSGEARSELGAHSGYFAALFLHAGCGGADLNKFGVQLVPKTKDIPPPPRRPAAGWLGTGTPPYIVRKYAQRAV